MGTVLLTFGSSNGLVVRQSSFVKVVRNEPLKLSPPERVMALTTPPVKRPYSAEMPDVETVVSWIASSMKSENGVPRMLSWIWTPSSMKRLSADIAPPMVTALFGPVACAAGERLTADSSVRAVGRVCRSSCWMLVDACDVFVKASARAVTVTTSLSAAWRSVTSTCTGCPAPTSRVTFVVAKPVSSTVIV